MVGIPFSEEENALIRSYGVKDLVVHEGVVSDQGLERLYRESLCFVFPSLREGFGLPLIEALRQGCVPVVSDIPVFKELVGITLCTLIQKFSCACSDH